MKKVFDFEEAKKLNSPAMLRFLKSIYKTRMSEEEFVEAYAKVPYVGKKGDGISPSTRRGPDRARRQYRQLLNKFDFFARV